MRRRPPIPLLVLLVVVAGAIAVALVVRGGGASHTPAGQASASGAGGPQSQRSFLERVIPPPAENTTGPPTAHSVADLALRLPLERKVAQMFLWGFSGRDTNAQVFGDMSRLDIGGLVLNSDNYSSPSQLSRLTGLASQVARRNRHIPPWLLTEQDGGEFNEFAGLPPADAPSNIQNVPQAASEAAQTAAALRRIGINGVLGPDVEVDTEAGGSYTRLSFSNVPAEVARFAAVTVRAFSQQHMLTAPKHFPGLGAADQPTDDGPANVGLSPQQLGMRDLVPFKAAFQAGAQGVLLGHGLYSTDDFVTPASESVTLTTDLLRGTMRFGGIAITDDLESPAITSFQSVPDAAVAAIKAGADMVWISGPRSDQMEAYLAVVNAARRGQIVPARINQAVLRILETKQRLGLISGK